jgi:hypothetical protein
MQATNVAPATGNARKAEPASHGFHVSSSIVNALARIAATTLISRGSGTRHWKLTLPAEQSEHKVLRARRCPRLPQKLTRSIKNSCIGQLVNLALRQYLSEGDRQGTRAMRQIPAYVSPDGREINHAPDEKKSGRACLGAHRYRSCNAELRPKPTKRESNQRNQRGSHSRVQREGIEISECR